MSRNLFHHQCYFCGGPLNKPNKKYLYECGDHGGFHIIHAGVSRYLSVVTGSYPVYCMIDLVDKNYTYMVYGSFGINELRIESFENSPDLDLVKHNIYRLSNLKAFI